MRIITCAGYYRTGSSAVTDFFSEFASCESVGDYEFRFIHDPDGIRDLEYNLIENNNRQNTNNAIKRYIRLAKMLNGGVIRKGYKRYMKNTFMEETDEYIDRITELKSESWWHFDQQSRGSLFNFIDLVYGKLYAKTHPKGRGSLLKLTHEKAYYSAIDKETFYKATKEYIESVLSSMYRSHTEFLMVDQLLPPSNINDYLNYFDDIKVVVVERDPRDLFILENEVYKWGNIPYKKVEEYCKWYEITRRHRKKEVYDREHVFFLQFEDLIYKYEETAAQLVDFIGLDEEDHVRPRQCFDPTVSINGTNLARNHPNYSKEIEYIESYLQDYLYSFPIKYDGS